MRFVPRDGARRRAAATTASWWGNLSILATREALIVAGQFVHGPMFIPL